MNEAGEAGRKGVLGELQRDVSFDGSFAQIRRRDLAAEPMGQQVELEREEGMARLRGGRTGVPWR